MPTYGTDKKLSAENDRERPRGYAEGEIMQMAITFLAVVGGLVFSVAVALLAEEFIFGQVIRVFFVRSRVAAKAEQKS
jgi:hypothetical protein